MVKQMGFAPVCLGGKSDNLILKNLQLVYSIVRLLWKIEKNDEVFWQFPYIYNFKKLFLRVLVVKKAKYTILVHDLDDLRGGKCLYDDELKLLRNAKNIIVNTEAVKEILQTKIKCEQDIRVTYVWDYITDHSCLYSSHCGNSVCFAGNLEKAPFVKHLCKVDGKLHFYVYGDTGEYVSEECDNIQFMGRFSADDIENVKGDWGLVWDGESIETCSGCYGDYLRINSSHKNALYLACGKPLIVWNQSAMKNFVKDNGIGIVINSLNDIQTSIDSLSDAEKALIKKNVRRVSERIKKGYYFKKSLNLLEKQ